MKIENYIPISQLCSSYEVEVSFFGNLYEMGLVEIITIEEDDYIHLEKLNDVEKIIRMHNDLELNMEGIDVVFNLLRKVDQLQTELSTLRNRLQIYEGDS